MSKKFHLIAILGVLTAGAAHSQSVYLGPDAGPGLVVQLDAGIGTTVLDGVHFLPLEISGRTLLDSLDPSRPRLIEDVPGANRVRLPGDQGSLYRYSSARPTGDVFGFLVVDSAGTARVAFEVHGYGPEGSLDPLEGFCAIEGSTLWVTSVPEVGGDLYEIDLALGTAKNRTTGQAPLAFHSRGLALFPTYGIAMTQTGPLRLDRAGSPAHPLDFDGVPPLWFAPDVVSSEDGSTFAFVAGDSATSTHVFYGRGDGPIRRASETPTGLTHAGFAYDTRKGPWLSLSTDGSVCAWITQGASRELFVRRIDAAVPAPEFHVTHDQRFTDTLNDSGVISFFSPDALVCLVGDESGSSLAQIESADVFRVDVLADATTDVRNLSNTSGDAVAPFLYYGRLSSVGGVWRVPGFDGLVAMDDVDQAVVAVDWNGGVSHLVDGVVTIEGIYQVGDEAVLQALMAAPTEDEQYAALYRLAPLTGLVEPLGELTPGGTFTPPAIHPAGLFASVGTGGGDAGWLGCFVVPMGVRALLSPLPLTYGPTQGFAPGGELLTTIEFLGTSYFLEWSAAGVEFFGQVPHGFVLPGL